MAAITFPSSRTLNQTFTSNSITWTWNGTKWKTGGVSSTPAASGAVTYPFGTDTVNAFTTSGTLTLASNVYARILVVAGGGGGSGYEPYSYGGGGGAGGLLYYSNFLMTAGTYTVTIGTGGLGTIPATNGSNSSIIGGSISYTAIGGGHGGGFGIGYAHVAPGNGGSGGGGYSFLGSDGTGTSGQGTNGSSGSGGGAWSTNGGQPDGGAGIINDIAGFPMSFSGGGASGDTAGTGSVYGMPGLGGGGGRGSGKFYSYSLPAGTTITSIYNSWSYGGGGSGRIGINDGGSGYQGIVIVRYVT